MYILESSGILADFGTDHFSWSSLSYHMLYNGCVTHAEITFQQPLKSALEHLPVVNKFFSRGTFRKSQLKQETELNTEEFHQI